LSQADDVFTAHGLKGDTDRDCATERKNWGGMVEGAPVFRETETEANRYGEERRARDYRKMGIDWQEYQKSQEPKTVTREAYELISV